MATLFSSMMRVFLGLVLVVISSVLLCSSLIDLVSPVSIHSQLSRSLSLVKVSTKVRLANVFNLNLF